MYEFSTIDSMNPPRNQEAQIVAKHEISLSKRNLYKIHIFPSLTKPCPPIPTLPSPPTKRGRFPYRTLLPCQDTGDSRERIRNISLEIESTTRLMHYNLLLIHQSQPVPDVLETAKGRLIC